MSQVQISRSVRGGLFNIRLSVLDLKVLYKRWKKGFLSLYIQQGWRFKYLYKTVQLYLTVITV